MTPEERERLVQMYDDNSKMARNLTVFVVVGPFGAGKSELAAKLCGLHSNLVHIDGDVFCPDTQMLGPERSEATMARVNMCILQGFIPVISTGGGVLTSTNWRKKLLTNFGNEGSVVTIVVGRPTGDALVEEQVDSFDPRPIYMHPDIDYYAELVKTRRERGVWGYGMEPETVMNMSRNNVQFAKTLVDTASKVYSAPAVKPDSVVKNLKAAVDGLVDNEECTGKFKQIRCVVMKLGAKNTARHVTLKFDLKGMELSAQQIKDEQDKFLALTNEEKKFPATLFKFSGTMLGDTSKKPKAKELAVAFCKLAVCFCVCFVFYFC